MSVTYNRRTASNTTRLQIARRQIALEPALDVLPEAAQHEHERHRHQAARCDDLEQLGVIHEHGSDSVSVIGCGT